jgi:acyl-CoA synthetase (AMP-forming)/AMP-acid ligase II
VADVAVIGLPDQEWGESVAAVVVLVEGAEVGPDELAAWVAARLRSTRAPTRVEYRPALPYSETGKLLRRQLKIELSATPA